MISNRTKEFEGVNFLTQVAAKFKPIIPVMFYYVVFYMICTRDIIRQKS